MPSFTWLNGEACGSWDVKPVVGSLPQKVASAFDELDAKFIGAKYEPLVYAGKQQANGTNHAVVALQTIPNRTPIKNIVLMKFNEKGMNCSLYSIEPLIQEGPMFGGYNIDPKTNLDEEDIKAFRKGVEGYVGCKLTPIALLATKVVKGINSTYLVLASSLMDDSADLMMFTVNTVARTIDFCSVFE